MKHVWVAEEKATGRIDTTYWWRTPGGCNLFCGNRNKVYPHLTQLCVRKVAAPFNRYFDVDRYDGKVLIVKNPLKIYQHPYAERYGDGWNAYPKWLITPTPLRLYDLK